MGSPSPSANPSASPTPTPTMDSTSPIPEPEPQSQCYLSACGCSPFTGGAAWCGDSNAKIGGDWCQISASNCETCSGVWCSFDSSSLSSPQVDNNLVSSTRQRIPNSLMLWVVAFIASFVGISESCLH